MNKGKKICAIIILAVIAAIIAIFFFGRSGGGEIKKTGIELSAKLEREKLISFIKEQIDFPFTDFIARAIPEEVILSCCAEFTGDKEKPVTFSQFAINGKKIPRELYENYLDFSCSLVYN